MTKVTIDRELLEQIDETAICDGTDATISDDLFTKLVAALAAPRQPDGDGLEVVAWQDAENPLYTTAERRQMHRWATDGYPVVELCRLSDAQRAIAELRELIGAAQRVTCAVIDERDTLRQQLDEVKEQSETRWGGYVRESNLRRAIEQQRDKLAEILRDIVPGCKWKHMRPRIDAALAEIDHDNE